jgi:hypothetical protein
MDAGKVHKLQALGLVRCLIRRKHIRFGAVCMLTGTLSLANHSCAPNYEVDRQT